MPLDIPLATYRLQLTKDFGFDEAAAVVPYLKRLGITHLYASPFLKARPSSTHGYDIVDHDRLSPELGGEEAFARLSAALKQHDLGLILDFVPNHMGVGRADNAWWLDVLEWGPRSPHATFFDIDWDGLPYRRHPGILIPILGRPYGEALQAGEIELRYDADAGSFAAWYFEHKLPINPQRYSEMLRTIVAAADGAETEAGRELIALADAYPDPQTPSYREAPELKRRLAAIAGAETLIDGGLAAFRGGSEAGNAALHRLLERQYYRVAYWRVAFSNVNYRRFFDISDLAGLRVENPAVFRAIHKRVASLIEAGDLQGLRLDHIDGLRDPAQYARRLKRLIGKLRPGPFFTVVEKILAEGETMPSWPGIAGTTGYELLNSITRALIDGDGLASLQQTWRAFAGEQTNFRNILDAAKRQVIDTMLASEFTVLARALARIAAGNPATRDFTMERLRAALQLFALEFPVYRTYVTAAGATAADRKTIEDVVARARARWQGPDPQVFELLRDAVTADLAGNSGYSAPRVRNFALKLQQFTGPLMAKAMEDTAFYRYHVLLALNEVGSDPSAGALPLAAFHDGQRQRAKTAAAALSATATHDTKRGEDARARIMALSEMAEEWQRAVAEWRVINTPLARSANGKRSPSLNHEYMLYQALIGAWPDRLDEPFTGRMQAYAVKAAREAKQDTSWTNADEPYEAGLRDFVVRLLDRDTSAQFVASFEAFAARTLLIGALNSLSQLALKAMLPGAPDVYQGTELWDLSLVDPDNRRPVDFPLRQRLLAESLAELPPGWERLAASWRDGCIKLALVHELLRARHAHADVFQHGGYEPLSVTGAHADHVIAFARSFKGQQIIVAAGRHFAPLTNAGRHWPADWQATIDARPGQYEILVGADGQTSDLSLAMLFANIPVAVLRRL